MDVEEGGVGLCSFFIGWRGIWLGFLIFLWLKFAKAKKRINKGKGGTIRDGEFGYILGKFRIERRFFPVPKMRLIYLENYLLCV